MWYFIISFSLCFACSVIVFLLYEFTHEVVSPSVLPCLGSLTHYLCRVAAQLLMDAGVTGKAQSLQALKSAVDSQPLHLVFGSGGLDGNYMMNASGTGDDTMLHALLAQPSRAPEFRDAQLLPLTAVVDVGFIFSDLIAHTSPVTLLCHS